MTKILASRRRVGSSRPPVTNRQVLVIALALAAVVAASAAVVVFTAERLRGSVEPKSAERLASCLSDNMVPNLAVDGESIIERACNDWVRDNSSPAARCVFDRRARMVNEDAALAVAKACGVPPATEP